MQRLIFLLINRHPYGEYKTFSYKNLLNSSCFFFRRIRSSSFLLLLAITDIFFLLDLLPGWIYTGFVRSLYRRLHIICNIQTYISFVASFAHIWMVLAFTAERFFAVNFPLKHMSECTRRLTRLICFLIITPACLFYIYPAFFASEVDKYGQCREKETHVRFLNHINMIDTFLTMFLPFVLVSILNIAIIRKLFCTTTFRQYVSDNGSSYQCRRSSNWTQNPQYSKQKNQIHGEHTSPITRKIQQRHESARRHILTELRLTKMLLAISLTCLLLNFPSYYSRLIFYYQQSNDELSMTYDYTLFALYRDIILHYMSYLSYSINIVIYFLFGVHFRRVFKKIFFPQQIKQFNRLKLKSFNTDNDTWSLDFETTGSLNGSIRGYSRSPQLRKQNSLRHM